MESLPMMYIIGKLVWNCNINCQHAQQHNYLIAQFLIFTQEPVFWLFTDKSNQKMEQTKGDFNTISRNIVAVKDDSLRIEGIPLMPKIATVLCNYNFKIVLISIIVKTWNLLLQNYNISCYKQEAGVILHMYTNILDFVTTQTWKQNNSWKIEINWETRNTCYWHMGWVSIEAILWVQIW